MWPTTARGSRCGDAAGESKRDLIDHSSLWVKARRRDYMCPTCRRAHDDSAATAKVLLMVSLAAAASGQMLTAVALLMTSSNDLRALAADLAVV